MEETKRILFIGDSLTEWFDLGKYFSDISILNEGIAGDTTYGVLERIDGIMANPADKIFLMIGINDIFNGYPKEDIIENLQLIIEEIQTQSIESELIIQNLLPVNEHMLGSPNHLNKIIRHINENLKEHCQARGIINLNLYSSFLSGDQLDRKYTTDGGHLSEEGYALWAEKIHAFLPGGRKA
ncbi:MAG: GDSL-type esterase/lipase family protein [Bacteroidota bacterium]